MGGATIIRYMDDLTRGEIVIYESTQNRAQVEVRIEKETIWMNQAQIALLFQTERSVITKHINNVFRTLELDKQSNVQKMHIAKSDKPISFYNLNVIISIGYRVNSKRATQFRIWATSILKEHLVQGYTINEKKMLAAKAKFKELQQTIAFIKEKSKKKLLHGKAEELLELIAEYSHTFTLLDQFDKGLLPDLVGNEIAKPFSYSEANSAIEQLRKNLPNKKLTDMDLFGNEKDHGLEAVIGGIYQTYNGKELYITIEEKASNLLYLVIKDHPFLDGNNRIGSFLFLHFLQKHTYLYKKTGEKKINDNAMTALALLIAESNPKEKELMIALIVNLL